MTQASQLAKLEPARPQIKAVNAAAVDNAGIKILNLLYMENINMVWRHPKYYKELRKRNKLDQAISSQKTVDVGDSVRPGPGPKRQASSGTGPGAEPQASSSKPQASSAKQVQVPDASVKPQA